MSVCVVVAGLIVGLTAACVVIITAFLVIIICWRRWVVTVALWPNALVK